MQPAINAAPQNAGGAGEQPCTSPTQQSAALDWPRPERRCAGALLHCRAISDSKKKRAEAKAAKDAAKGKTPNASASNLSEMGSEVENSNGNGLAKGMDELGLNDRSTTGVLTSHPQSRDIQFDSFSLLFHGHELLADTKLELNYGR